MLDVWLLGFLLSMRLCRSELTVRHEDGEELPFDKLRRKLADFVDKNEEAQE